jgi:hypothetical protein
MKDKSLIGSIAEPITYSSKEIHEKRKTVEALQLERPEDRVA